MYDLVNKLFTFSSTMMLPVLDIYRMFLMHPGSTENYKVFETGRQYVKHLITILDDSTVSVNT